MSKLDPTILLQNLQIDNMNVKTNVAEQFIKNYNGEFLSRNSSKFYDCKKSALDSYGNKIYYVEASTILEFMIKKPNHCCQRVSDLDLSTKMRKLANEIIAQTTLLCQLEFLIRKIPFTDTKHSIDLIVQNLLYTSEQDEGFDSQDSIVFSDTTPLVILGFVVQIFLQCDEPLIVATKESAVICTLFGELYRKAGWKYRLLFIEDLYIQEVKKVNERFNVYPDIFDGIKPEVTGVITDISDLDSAVDVLLSAGNHPFQLTRIFVQEVIYGEFKKILSWKCKREKYDSKCTDSFQYGDKTIVLDFPKPEECQPVVFVEAYRTVNDLISLLSKSDRRLCLSLWANGISEANEIALKVNIPIVWINDYFNFKGPNEISQAIFRRIRFRLLENVVHNVSTVNQLRKKQRTWLQKSYMDRCLIIVHAITKINESLGAKLKTEALEWKINNFLSNENKTLVMGFNEPVEGIIGYCQKTADTDIFANVVKALLNGNAVVVNKPTSEFNYLLTEDIPIAFDVNGGEKASDSKIDIRENNWIQQTKVIFTNFGTAFAN